MPSLCAGWTVRDVVAHLASYDGVDEREVGRRLLRRGLSLRRANATGIDDLVSRPTDELVDLLRGATSMRGLPRRLAGPIVLTDTLVHHQDIRRPLGLPREIPAERLRAALRYAVVLPPVRGAWHGRGVRVVATDLDWRFGVGPEARGTGEAVLLTLTARPGAARELDGPGAATLVGRFG